jgi:ribosomal protein S18 acetylase RimI-like enzyme
VYIGLSGRHDFAKRKTDLDQRAKVKADIVGYTAEYSAAVRSWINSAETFFALCRNREFPPPEDIVDSWQRAGIASYILLADRKPAAYGELWDRPQKMAVEIAHLLVDPARRGIGLGTKMLTLLYERAAGRKAVSQVLLNLYVVDEDILSCYLRAGFEILGTSEHMAGLRLVRLVK